jgi:hypothetical protein
MTWRSFPNDFSIVSTPLAGRYAGRSGSCQCRRRGRGPYIFSNFDKTVQLAGEMTSSDERLAAGMTEL